MAIIPCIALGYMFDINLESKQLMDRTIVDFAAIAVAMASGAAAVLSMTTGVSSALVGVMVSVALLPPAAAVGLFLGIGEGEFAWESFLLLMTNMVCIGLSSQMVNFIAYRNFIHYIFYRHRCCGNRQRNGSKINL